MKTNIAICNLSQDDYDNLVRDAIKWRTSQEPIRLALQQFCNAFTNNGKTSSLRDWNYRMKEAYDNAVLALGGYSEPTPEPNVDGPCAFEANEILGKPGYYKP